MAFLRNAWYVAAWSSEIGGDLFARTILDVPIVFYRDGGKIVALHDRCPHRFAPLSLGTLVDGTIRCGYHGLFFDGNGQCVKNLFSGATPRAAKVRSFPIVEQDNMIWIWMGDQPAVASEIPRFPHHADPAMICSFGLTTAKADYRLLSDNLMDLSHTALLHPLFGGLDYLPKHRSWEEDGVIFSSYVTDDMPNFTGGEGAVHNHDEIRWIAPSIHYLESRITPKDGSNQTAFIPSAHILTPESETTTHYFWSSAMDASSPVSADDMHAVLVQAFDFEDKPMVEAVQRRMGGNDLWDLDPILLPNDSGSVRVRRRLKALIDAEQATQAEAVDA